MTAPYIPNNYTSAEPLVRRLADMVTSYDQEGLRAINDITEIVASFSRLADGYPKGFLEAVQLIRSEHAAAPDDPAWTDLDARLTKIIADYQALRAYYVAVESAIAGVQR